MPENEQNLANVNENVNENQVEGGSSTDYINAIKELKKNSVSKEEYAKLQAENKSLVEALIDGGQVNVQQEQPEDPNTAELIQAMNEEGISNLEYCSRALALREAVIEQQGPAADPFVGLPSKNYTPTQEDYTKAQKVADIFQDCINKADGNPEVFNGYLKAAIIDDTIPTPQKKFIRK